MARGTNGQTAISWQISNPGRKVCDGICDSVLALSSRKGDFPAGSNPASRMIVALAPVQEHGQHDEIPSSEDPSRPSFHLSTVWLAIFLYRRHLLFQQPRRLELRISLFYWWGHVPALCMARPVTMHMPPSPQR
jgi:hypothetical protein